MPDETVSALIAELRRMVPPSVEVTKDTAVTRDLGLDSLAVMNFVMALEDRFDISIPLDRIAEAETVEDLAETVRALRTGETV